MPKRLSKSPKRKKNPAAVALGRLGGKRSAEARMVKIPPAKRSAIARRAAKARWKRKKKPG